jgi:peptidoglycan hydrolase-like protein with peptidoglycan-binding domain
VPRSQNPNILRIQEGLVWTGYYEGPVDGSAGVGTRGAIKRFQHDIGKPETGSLDDPQAAMLAQRAKSSSSSLRKEKLPNRFGFKSEHPNCLVCRATIH